MKHDNKKIHLINREKFLNNTNNTNNANPSSLIEENGFKGVIL